MNKREKQKEETLLDILRVSEELFHELGYENTSIQNIADRCGLSKGALYHHFKSKEEVLERICYDQYLELKQTFLPIVEKPAQPMLEKLREIMEIARGGLMNTAAVTFLKSDSSKSPGIENAALGKLLDLYGEKVYIEVFAPLFDQGKRDGECSFPCSALTMAVFIHHLDTGMSEQLSRIMRSGSSLPSEVRDVIQGFTYALSRLLGIDEKTVAEVTLADRMLKTYLGLLRKRKVGA